MFEDFEAAFQVPMTFDYLGAAYAHLGFLTGHVFILAADSSLHWSQASKLLDGQRIAHQGTPLANGDCVFSVSENDGERAEALMEKHGGRVYHAPLDDILFF